MNQIKIDSTFSLNDINIFDFESNAAKNEMKREKSLSSQIDPEVTSDIVESIKTEGNEAGDDGNTVKVQCSNCDTLFAENEFTTHVCQFDGNREPIKSKEKIKSEEHPVFGVLKKNVETMKKLIKSVNKNKSASDKGSPAAYQCNICQRKFVRESGLIRHMDRHVGELMPQPDANANFLLGSRCMCGEVFADDKFAFDHIQSYHMSEKNEGLWKKPWSQNFFDDEDKEKMIPPFPKLEPIVEITESNEKIVLNDKIEPSDSDESSKEDKPLFLPGSKFEASSIFDIIKPIYLHMTLQCEFCEALFSDTRSLLCHASEHNPAEGFCCNRCDIKCLTMKMLLLHRLSSCIGQIERSQINSLEKAFICNVCYTEYGSLESLVEHRYKDCHFFPRYHWVRDEILFLCEYCCEQFPHAEELIKHFEETHKQNLKREIQQAAVSTTIEENVEQTVSPSKKASGTNYTSTKYRQYLCEVCGKSYTQSSHLWQHLRFHKGVKPFACNVEGCDRRFTIRPDLNDHIRKCHTGERPYHCTICGKRFLTGSVYYQHRLIHRGERRYGCDDCGKRFYRADALKNHQRIHTGEKPFACIHCPKSFRQRGDRDKHIKARHPNLPPVPPVRKPPKFSFGKGRVRNNTECNPPAPQQSPIKNETV